MDETSCIWNHNDLNGRVHQVPDRKLGVRLARSCWLDVSPKPNKMRDCGQTYF